ncbi:mannose-6-phosphate isomerase [Novosphingobium sp. SG751A]|uniref:class I mannose-6-phosphate isomerase n=1 Tax=Novosphingobium sp. SG751A TaxID=2587000 RepID=UPI0020A6C467|nr:class I mannose-6-phosphate isomerase [Novosphingobium sp. SG751A]NOW48428.1 mannose-6-phosphate isomerase [Novosphingobium sp. SG751A]
MITIPDPHVLAQKLVEKPWGRTHLPPQFEALGDRRIGEIWFEPPAQCPELLVKYIFTSENLSVQVHPNDAQTLAKGLGKQGKEECWLVLSAEPGAKLGIGFHGQIDEDRMRAAAMDGSIKDQMVWHEVVAGDFFYIPANTVHAIGAGVTLLEVQQNSDITYRLYDYGRPRELHLDDGIAVALGETYDLSRWHRHVDLNGGTIALVDGPYFRMDHVVDSLNDDLLRRYGNGPVLVVPLKGGIWAGKDKLVPGTCAMVSHADQLGLGDDDAALVIQSL